MSTLKLNFGIVGIFNLFVAVLTVKVVFGIFQPLSFAVGILPFFCFKSVLFQDEKPGFKTFGEATGTVLINNVSFPILENNPAFFNNLNQKDEIQFSHFPLSGMAALYNFWMICLSEGYLPKVHEFVVGY